MFTWETVGYIAAIFGAVSLVPEVLNALRTHRLQDLAWGMIFFMLSSSVGWLLYALHAHEIPLVLSSSINLTMETTLIALKIHYSKKQVPLFPHKDLAEKPNFATESVLAENNNDELVAVE